MTTAATGGTMGYHLNIFKGLFHLPEILTVMEGFFNIIVSNLFTVTDFPV